MPEYLSPGVYIEEIPGPQPIQGVSTSTTGMVGVTRKGPTEGKPLLVTSYAEFRQHFGGFFGAPSIGGSPSIDDEATWGFDDNEGGRWWLFPLAVKGFFDNGGRRLFVKRVFSRDATASETEVPSGVVLETPGQPDRLTLGPSDDALPSLLRISANARGEWGNDIRVRVVPAPARRIPAVAQQGGGPVATTLAANVERDDTAAQIRWRPQMAAVTGPVTVVLGALEPFEIAAPTAPTGGETTVTITLEGPPGVRLRAGTPVKILRQVDTADGDLVRVPLANTSEQSVYPGALVLVGPNRVRATVSSVVPPNPVTETPGAVLLAGEDISPVFETQQVVVVEAEVGVAYEPAPDPAAGPGQAREVVEETFRGLRMHPLSGHTRSIVNVVTEESRLIDMEEIPVPPGETPPVISWDLFPGSIEAGNPDLQLGGGNDALGGLRVRDFVGEDGGSGERTGIQALEDIEEISLCAVPGMWSITVQSALTAHCSLLRDRFAILDPQLNLGVQDVQAFRQRLDSDYAALYHPWLRLVDPLSGQEVSVPPSGHLAGIYARVDVERGVHKAPANEVIFQISDLADDINQREQDLLNPIGINALRAFPNRGRRVWGARTVSSIPEWRYVNVRRLFIYIEDSIKQGTQWVVFEPNGEALWSLVRQAITNFLDTVWRSGALEGTTQAQAFYVRCDRSTMSLDDVANGRLIVEIGIAATRPAEFVIFRFRQKTRDQVAAA